MLPFPAILGQEHAQKALLLNLVSPRIGGVLLTGAKGSAKSTLVRSMAGLHPGTRILNVPVGISEERLFGGMDWEAAVKTGRRVFSPGLLAEAHGQILYLDEVNLMDENTVHAILDATEQGESKFEREGLSLSYPCSFSLVASMNPEEGALPSPILDRFGLSVTLDGVSDLAVRKEIIKRSLACENASLDFLRKWRVQEEDLELRIREARIRLTRIRIPREPLEAAVVLSLAKGCLGHRGELAVCRSAKALAAWSGKEIVSNEDILEIAAYALNHRATTPEKKTLPEGAAESEFLSRNESSGVAESRDRSGSSSAGTSGSPPPQPEDNRLGITEGYSAPDLPIHCSNRKEAGSKKGRRHPSQLILRTGRTRGDRLPGSQPKDIAWDATLKQSLFFQAARPKGTLCVSIRPEDIRVKHRKGKTGRILLFLVDASGSMGVKKRIAAAKGCINAALKEAYLRRDRVALMAFRRKECRLLLPLTRSPALSEQLLLEIPTGGETPLSLGLTKALEFYQKIKTREPATPFHVLLFTDGRANSSQTGRNPFEESMDICAKAVKENLSFSVVDTETGFVRLGMAYQIARHLNASYCRLEDLLEHTINPPHATIERGPPNRLVRPI